MKVVQIRNVPDHVHPTLKARAAMAGLSLSDYLLEQLEAAARRPTIDEVIAYPRGRRGPSLRGQRHGRAGHPRNRVIVLHASTLGASGRSWRSSGIRICRSCLAR